MKKQMLAAALSCAVLAMVAAPSAFAVTDSANFSGVIGDGGDGITFTDGTATGFTIDSTDTAATLAGTVDKCYVETVAVTSASNFFTVTDTDATAGHDITVAPADANFTVGTGGSTVPTSALSLTLEKGAGISCPIASDDTVAGIVSKVAGHTSATVADDITVSTTVFDSTASIAYVALDSATPKTLITSDGTEAFQYKFRIGALKMTWPQYTKVGTYTTTLVFTYTP